MRISILSLLGFVMLISSCSNYPTNDVSIIPQPQNYAHGHRAMVFDDGLQIFYSENDTLKKQAEYFANLVADNLGMNFLIAGQEDKIRGNKVILKITAEPDTLGPEGYTLDVGTKTAMITAKNSRGTFYGIQSLFQILQSGNRIMEDGKERIVIPIISIEDEPAFPYRGMHLDVCRHMFPVEFIKKYIDLLAYYKFNTFHWHLTEDQGWRIEIKKYPKLNEIGSWRKETVVGHGGKKPHVFDGKPYGGYYTQDEVREIVEYAAQRQITVIPEIEMPGHSLAALASYPELGCTGGPYEVGTKWGVFKDIYCTKEPTFEFLENVLLEVMELFPSKYIHIGGDEAPKDRWKECKTCQKTIKREGLEDEHELQSYFISRMEKFLNSHGRDIIGWDEILEGGLAPNATVMSWRGTAGGVAAAGMGHDAVMTPWSHCYFDHYQVNPEGEPLAIGGYTTMEKVYSYQPVPDTFSVVEASHILGAQGNVWTEYIPNSEHVEYMILPRMAALSEVVWTGKKDWEYFKIRIDDHFKYYDQMGYNYCDDPYNYRPEKEK